jgi:hypothetical protein
MRAKRAHQMSIYETFAETVSSGAITPKVGGA